MNYPVHNTQPVAFLPALPWIIGGGATLAAGWWGYHAGKPDVDPTTGKRIPTFGETAGKTAGSIIGWTAAGLAVLWFLKKK